MYPLAPASTIYMGFRLEFGPKMYFHGFVISRKRNADTLDASSSYQKELNFHTSTGTTSQILFYTENTSVPETVLDNLLPVVC